MMQSYLFSMNNADSSFNIRKRVRNSERGLTLVLISEVTSFLATWCEWRDVHKATCNETAISYKVSASRTWISK